MTTQPIPVTRYDLVEIDARARQMRADMLTGAFRRLIARLHSPRGMVKATVQPA